MHIISDSKCCMLHVQPEMLSVLVGERAIASGDLDICTTKLPLCSKIQSYEYFYEYSTSKVAIVEIYILKITGDICLSKK